MDWPCDLARHVGVWNSSIHPNNYLQAGLLLMVLCSLKLCVLTEMHVLEMA